MKKSIILPVLLCLAAMNIANKANAQSARFGIKAGAVTTTLGKFDAGTTDYNYDYRYGFQGGVYADLPLTSGFSFMPQVLYTQKGGDVSASASTSGPTYKVKTQISYLDVPLVFGFKPASQLTITAGPQVAFLLSQSTSTSVNQAAVTTDTNTKDFRKSIIGGNVGLGYNFNDNVSLNANYMFDFQSAGNDNVNQSKAKNSGFGLSIGYLF